jgi:hypothetical protein
MALTVWSIVDWSNPISKAPSESSELQEKPMNMTAIKVNMSLKK